MNAYSESACFDHQTTPGHPGVFIFDTQTIEWRAIPVDPRYEVSETGLVRNRRTGHILKPWLAGFGYHYVALGGKELKTGIHRLVAMAFHGMPTKEAPEVAHYDGNPLNNSATNLRWATRKENVEDQRRHGTLHAPVMKGASHPRSKLTEIEIREIRERSDWPESVNQIAAKYGVCQSTIYLIKRGKAWKHLPA